MFARHVSIKLQPNSAPEFSRIIENEILPLLREQKGFRDEITFVAPERSLAIGISLWDTIGDAEAYNLTGYPNVLKGLSKVVEGTPTVETYEVASSTLYKTAAKTA